MGVKIDLCISLYLLWLERAVPANRDVSLLNSDSDCDDYS